MVDRLKESLEAAIADDFDDRAAHAAYADLLQDRGDPRGELIAVQLALEDEQMSWQGRHALTWRECELLDAHGREWLGDLPPYFTLGSVPDHERRPIPLRLCRGWIESVHIRHATARIMDTFARAPLARCLQRLEIDYGYEESEWNDETYETIDPLPVPPGTPQENEFYVPLREAPFLANLRRLRVGEIRGAENPDLPYEGVCCSGGRAELLHTVLERTPRLEELRLLCFTRTTPRFDPAPIFRLPLPNLRYLQAYNLFDHATATLADNPSLTKLTHLLFHSHADDPCFDQRGPYLTLDDLRRVLNARHLKSLKHLQFRLSSIGNEGCALIARSGILKRLDVLDLRHGSVTDAGVRHLVRCPDLKRLTQLELSRNALTPRGVAMLQGSGVPFGADDPHPPQDTQWLYEGDFE